MIVLNSPGLGKLNPQGAKAPLPPEIDPAWYRDCYASDSEMPIVYFYNGNYIWTRKEWARAEDAP